VRLGDGTRLEADAVVLAAGVWTPALVRELGVRLPIRPRKGHLVVAARGHRFGSVKVMEFGYLATKFGRQRAADPEAERYGVALVYEPTMSGNFLLGSSREFVGFDTTPDMAVARAIVRRALRFYPTMRNASALRVYAGLRPWTPDHRPVIGPVDAVPGLVVAAGHEGDGVGLSAVTGALVRDVLHERGPLVDLDPLRWDRFAGVGWEEAEDEPAGT
jgi:glycine/D-amino acid oxidase-like deaminating enzyme